MSGRTECPESLDAKGDAGWACLMKCVLASAGFFWPLFAHGENDPGLVEMNLLFRGDDLFPQGLVTQCLFFGDNGCGPQWGIKRELPGKVVLWDAEWGNQYEIAGEDPLEVWTAEKRMYEDLDAQEEA